MDLATGDSVSLHERYRGKVTLVNIWATWCVPCRVEMPAMEQLYDSLAPRGFAIAAVSIDEGCPDDVRAFGQELNLSFDLLQDRSTASSRSIRPPASPRASCSTAAASSSSASSARTTGAHRSTAPWWNGSWTSPGS